MAKKAAAAPAPKKSNQTSCERDKSKAKNQNECEDAAPRRRLPRRDEQDREVPRAPRGGGADKKTRDDRDGDVAGAPQAGGAEKHRRDDRDGDVPVAPEASRCCSDRNNEEAEKMLAGSSGSAAPWSRDGPAGGGSRGARRWNVPAPEPSAGGDPFPGRTPRPAPDGRVSKSPPYLIDTVAAQHAVRAMNGNIPPRPLQMRPGDYTCPACGSHNFSRRTDCFRCHAPRPAGGRSRLPAAYAAPPQAQHAPLRAIPVPPAAPAEPAMSIPPQAWPQQQPTPHAPPGAARTVWTEGPNGWQPTDAKKKWRKAGKLFRKPEQQQPPPKKKSAPPGGSPPAAKQKKKAK
eukprot:gene12845-13622_t